jgi:hypothetical protein
LLRDAETFQQLAKSDLVNPLVQEAAQAPDAARTLYGSPLLARHVVEHLVATKQVGLLLESARNSKDENSRRSYLQSLLQNNLAMQALTAGDEFPALLTLLKSDSDPQWQGILQGLLMRSPLALRALLAQDDSTFSLEQLFAQANAASRQQLFNYMLSSPDSIGLLIERGQFEVLTRLITQYFHGADRGSFIGRLLTSPKSLDHLAASKRLNLLLETAQPQPADAEFSQAYLSVLLGDRSAVSRLIEQEQYEALFTLANGTDDSAARAVRLSRLFSVPPAVEQMLARKQVHQVFDLVRADQPAEARRAYLTQFAGNEPMLNVLIDASLFEEFAGFCRGEPDSRARLQCYGGLLSSARAIEQLAAAKQLDAVWAEVTAGPDDNDRRNAFYQLLSRRPALTALVAQGKFDALLALSKTIGDANGTEQLANALVNDPAVVVTLLEKVGIEATLRQFYGSPTDAQRQRFVQRLVSNEATRRATLRAGRLDELLAVARTLPETTRQSIIATLLRGADTIDEFAQAGKLPVLWELLVREADSAPQLRMQFLQSLLWQPEGKRLLELLWQSRS